MSMENEFPCLEYREHQNKFLSDWWSSKKLFKGDRRSGKSTLIMCELNRFTNRGIDCVVIAPTRSDCNQLKNRYGELFGKHPPDVFYSLSSKHGLRGLRPDVVLIDDADVLETADYHQYIAPMNHHFLRCASTHHGCFPEQSNFFDSIYSYKSN